MSNRADGISLSASEPVEVVPYDPAWPEVFLSEKQRLLGLLSGADIGRIEHIGSTAVPGLHAKPIVDLMVEVPDLEMVRSRVAPTLEKHGYTFLWRPTSPGDPDIDYAWFIRRDEDGRRVSHVHMAPAHSPYWDRVVFRDYLVSHPDVAKAYSDLKRRAAAERCTDRKAYAKAKGRFIRDVLRKARRRPRAGSG